MKPDYRVAAISGSLRARSYNSALLRAAANQAPAGVEVIFGDLSTIPMYNGDDEKVLGYPDSVQALRGLVGEADALLVATPEYNGSFPGVLKNALDWASRGGADSPLNRVPVAMLGVGGRFGTLRAQLHLRDIMLHNEARVVDDLQVYIARSDADFDDDRKVTTERYVHQIERLVAALAELVNQG